MMKPFKLSFVSFVLYVVQSFAAFAQYPARTVTIVVPFPPAAAPTPARA
jgi:tripartite-type tricarboxylate transporter receptor subunit TctC